MRNDDEKVAEAAQRIAALARCAKAAGVTPQHATLRLTEVLRDLQQAHSAGALRGAVAYWRLRGLPDD